MKQFLKSKKLRIALVIIIPVLIIFGIFVSNYPLFYLSDVTVERIEFYQNGLNVLDDYKQYNLCKVLSSMNVGNREKYETKIATSLGGFTYNVRIKLCFNKSVYVRVSSVEKHITVNSKYVYECSKEDAEKILDILNRASNQKMY